MQHRLLIIIYIIHFAVGALSNVDYAVPLKEGNWKILAFKSIQSNKVSFTDKSMKVEVQKSASPLLHKLPTTKEVQSIYVKGRISGTLKLSGKQGDKGSDDFLLRVGLVAKGAKTLNFMQKAVAPKWVKELHALAPKGEGIDRIEFFNLTSEKSLLDKSRVHPLSDLLYENFVWQKADEGEFELNYSLKKPILTSALWLSIDGDDSGSSFTIEIDTLVLK